LKDIIPSLCSIGIIKQPTKEKHQLGDGPPQKTDDIDLTNENARKNMWF